MESKQEALPVNVPSGESLGSTLVTGNKLRSTRPTVTRMAAPRSNTPQSGYGPLPRRAEQPVHIVSVGRAHPYARRRITPGVFVRATTSRPGSTQWRSRPVVGASQGRMGLGLSVSNPLVRARVKSATGSPMLHR